MQKPLGSWYNIWENKQVKLWGLPSPASCYQRPFIIITVGRCLGICETLKWPNREQGQDADMFSLFDMILPQCVMCVYVCTCVCDILCERVLVPVTRPMLRLPVRREAGISTHRCGRWCCCAVTTVTREQLRLYVSQDSSVVAKSRRDALFVFQKIDRSKQEFPQSVF